LVIGDAYLQHGGAEILGQCFSSRNRGAGFALADTLAIDLAQRLADEATLVPRRTAIVERLHEREQQKTEDGDVDK
jgi:hypothetical protein